VCLYSSFPISFAYNLAELLTQVNWCPFRLDLGSKYLIGISWISTTLLMSDFGCSCPLFLLIATIRRSKFINLKTDKQKGKGQSSKFYRGRPANGTQGTEVFNASPNNLLFGRLSDGVPSVWLLVRLYFDHI